MKITVRLLTFVLALIGILSGARSILQGLSGAVGVPDNTFRFYAGIWFAVGLGLLHCAFRFDKSERTFAFLMRALIIGGIARAVGLLHYPAERPIIAAIAIEIVVPLVLLWMRSRIAAQRPAPRMKNGKAALVTGANGGLGRETIKFLLEDGYSRIVMACRSAAKGEAAKAEVLRDTGVSTDAITVVAGFDMMKPNALRGAVDALPKGEPFDTIFLQAGGVVFSTAAETVEYEGKRYERTAFQNVIGGHMVLARLAERDLIANGARVVYAGGEGARGIPGLIAKPTFADADALRRYVHVDDPKAPYNPMNAIGVSKLFGAWWTLELARRFGDKYEFLWFSPGLTYGTQGLSSAPALQRFFAENVIFKVVAAFGKAQSPRDGARKYADCLTGTIGRNGDIIGAPKGTALGVLSDQKPMNPAITDEALRAAFWQILGEVNGPFPLAESSRV